MVAGVVVGLVAVEAGAWRGELRRGGVRWSVAWTLSLATVCLLNGLYSVVAPGLDAEILLFGRYLALGAAVVLSLPAVQAYTSGPTVRVLSALTTAWFIAGGVLWWTTPLLLEGVGTDGLQQERGRPPEHATGDEPGSCQRAEHSDRGPAGVGLDRGQAQHDCRAEGEVSAEEQDLRVRTGSDGAVHAVEQADRSEREGPGDTPAHATAAQLTAPRTGFDRHEADHDASDHALDDRRPQKYRSTHLVAIGGAPRQDKGGPRSFR